MINFYIPSPVVRALAPTTRVLASADIATDHPNWSSSASPTIDLPCCSQIQGAGGYDTGALVRIIKGLAVVGDSDELVVMGDVVGAIVGLAVVGTSEGLAVVGYSEGLAVGVLVGMAVGVLVGLAVGVLVGMAVGDAKELAFVPDDMSAVVGAAEGGSGR